MTDSRLRGNDGTPRPPINGAGVLSVVQRMDAESLLQLNSIGFFDCQSVAADDLLTARRLVSL